MVDSRLDAFCPLRQYTLAHCGTEAHQTSETHKGQSVWVGLFRSQGVRGPKSICGRGCPHEGPSFQCSSDHWIPETIFRGVQKDAIIGGGQPGGSEIFISDCADTFGRSQTILFEQSGQNPEQKDDF